MREFINGSEAIVRAALDAGCNFFAGYPITPATSILLAFIRELPKLGGVAIQAEDEIASMGFCIGAALAGSRVMTATSGPGISLYSENIGAAIMAEVPMVIVDCQRLGPATGGATTVAQGDIQFLRWGTSGGYPVIVLSPACIPDCYNLTKRAFNLAERFRLPVFLATDKEMVTTNFTVDTDEFEQLANHDRRYLSSKAEFSPHNFGGVENIPPMTPFGGAHLLRFTTSSHDERGYLSKDPRVVGRLNEHLNDKIESAVDKISWVRFDGEEGAENLVISYGVTARSMVEAIGQARANGIKISALTLLTLWPVPENAILKALEKVQRVIVVELNAGQYRREIECLARYDQEVIGVHRLDGELISPQEILEKVKSS